MSIVEAADKDGQQQSDILPTSQNQTEICAMENASPNQKDASDIKILSDNDSGSSKAKIPLDSPMLVEVVHVSPPKLSKFHVIHEMKNFPIKKNKERQIMDFFKKKRGRKIEQTLNAKIHKRKITFTPHKMKKSKTCDKKKIR